MAMPDTEGLERLVLAAKGWCVMACMAPPGDVPFLVSPVPSLRWHEIISCDGKYDVWKWQKWGREILESQLTLEQMLAWLRERMPPEAEIEKNAAAWLEEMLTAYGASRRNIQ